MNLGSDRIMESLRSLVVMFCFAAEPYLRTIGGQQFSHEPGVFLRLGAAMNGSNSLGLCRIKRSLLWNAHCFARDCRN